MRAAGFSLLALLTVTLLTACGPNAAPQQQARPTEIIVSAAASMKDALNDASAAFSANHPEIRVKLNLGSSGTLQQQIIQGAPVDIFIAAAPEQVDSLVQKSLVEPDSVRMLASNKVVLICPKAGPGSVKAWDDLKQEQVTRIAIGNPQHVPAGQYAMAVLHSLGLAEAVEKRLVLGADVRQVLNYVETGAVEAGIVYATDAAVSQKVQVVAEAPSGSHPPVVYPMAELRESKHRREARQFADYLLSAPGQEILAKFGFGTGN